MVDEREGRFIIVQEDSSGTCIAAEAVSEDQAIEKAKGFALEPVKEGTPDRKFHVYQKCGTIEVVRKADYNKAK